MTVVCFAWKEADTDQKVAAIYPSESFDDWERGWALNSFCK
jgi:hypothetical protein